ncbi:MAG: tetratricopeptide repeat protein [Ignavibacteria bacterium]|nr:tetratricopeptide repeat protein [Ignavibacteria bacterium]
MKDHVELPFVHTAVSLAYIKKNRIKAALKILNEIVKRFPDFSEVHFYLGIAYDKLNSPDSALGFYNRALSSTIQLQAKQYSDCLVRIGVIKF